MGLSDYTPARQQVEVGRATLDFRGLGLDDFRVLIEAHFPDLEGLAELYTEATGNRFSMSAMQDLAMTLVSRAPVVAAHIIALAADEPAMIDKARSITAAGQLMCLMAILNLTCADVGGPKAALAMLPFLTKGVMPPSVTEKLAQATRAMTVSL